MNRTDRLYAIRESLRRAGGTGRTAARLAAEFEVSERTIKRDISALQAAGFPIWARTGRVGGYVVDAAATLPPVALTTSEVSGLAAAVAAHDGRPFDGAARAALTKILAVMDTDSRRRATDLAARIWIDGPAAGVPRTRAVVERALAEQRVVRLSGKNDHGRTVSAALDPILLAMTGGAWYFVGRNRDDGTVEWFELTGITRASLLAARAEPVPVSVVGSPPETARPLDLA